MALTSGKVIGQMSVDIGDGTDSDLLPDLSPVVAGDVVFTPTFTELHDPDVGTVLPSTITASVVNGWVTWNGQQYIYLTSNDPLVWNWRVDFNNLRYGAAGVLPTKRAGFNFDVPVYASGDNNVVDLNRVAPVPTATGTPVTRGLSAYEVWLQAGHVGTVNDYLASLVGPAGSGSGGSAGVSSVASRTGAVTLTSSDLTDVTTVGKAVVTAANAAAIAAAAGLGNVNNTSDLNKPVSAAQQAAINAAATSKQVITAARGVNFGDGLDTWANRGDNPTFSTDASYAYAATNGATKARIPVDWELLQPTPLGALDATGLANVKTQVTSATSRGMIANIDIHNYMRYKTSDGTLHVLGDGTLLQTWLTDLWTRLAAVFASNPLVEFGLMNEPHDIPVQQGTLGSEMFTNTTFDSNITGWTAVNSATLAQSTSQYHAGAGSLSITAGSNTGPQAASASITIDPTKQYQVSYWAKAATTARQVFTVINFSGASGYISTITPGSSFVSDSTSGWTQVVVSPSDITIPTGATSMIVAFAVNNAASGEVHYIDDVSLKTSSGSLSGAQVWEAQAQACVTAIRGAGATNWITVAGYAYSPAGSYWTLHPTWFITDPLNRSMPEAHYYADGAGSGTLSYAQTVTYATNAGFAGSGSSDALQVKSKADITAFLLGCRTRGLKPYIGEIGWFQSTAPITAAGNTVAANELILWNAWGELCYELFDQYNASVTYWSAGDGFAAFSYAYSIYLGTPNSSKTGVATIVEAHYPALANVPYGVTGSTVTSSSSGSGAVSSVATRTGAVTLTSSDLTDSTATGRSILQAASAAAVNTILGTASYRVRKTVDTSRASTTTTAADPDLQLTLPVGEYEFVARVFMYTTIAADFKVGILGQTQTYAFGRGESLANAALSTNDSAATKTQMYVTNASSLPYSGGALAFGGLTSASPAAGGYTPQVVQIEGSLVVTTAGVVSVAWAQSTSSADATIVGIGSTFVATKVA